MSNVFGRNLTGPGAGNDLGLSTLHAVSVMYGSEIEGGMVQAAGGGDGIASPIMSTSGAASSSEDIGYGDTLASMGKTFIKAVGEVTDGLSFRSGTIVNSVVKS